MTTYKFKINGLIVSYAYETLSQSIREARADNPGCSIRLQRVRASES